MVVVRVGRSGRSLLFVDDFGNVFVTPLDAFRKFLVVGGGGGLYSLFTRLPEPVSDGRFKPSPLLGGGGVRLEPGSPGWFPGVCGCGGGSVRVSEDAFSVKSSSRRDEKRFFDDKVVW